MMRMYEWFDEKKSAQVVAYFCAAEGGQIDVLKLVKLVYLADREAMARFGFPITNDRHVAMPHGPVNSLTLNYIDGQIRSEQWNDLISDRAGNRVGLTRALRDSDDDELSEADRAVLDTVWKQFGHMNPIQIRDWTHLNCPEWEDPEGSSTPIPHARTLGYLKVHGAREVATEISAQREVRSALAQLRRQCAD